MGKLQSLSGLSQGAFFAIIPCKDRNLVRGGNVAIRFRYLFLATLLGSALFAEALPSPTGFSFAKGAKFTVADYTKARQILLDLNGYGDAPLSVHLR